MKKIKVIHLITGLDIGGAETMLYKLVSSTDNAIFHLKVISLTDIGPVGKKINELGIPVISLGMKNGVPNPIFLFKLIRILRREKPDLLQTWMYHSDLIGFIAGKIAKVSKIVWGIRHSNLNLDENKKSTILIAKVCSKLSKYVDSIICCSKASVESHQEIGYDKNKMIILPNGFNLDEFRPDIHAKSRLVDLLKVNQDDFLIGMVGRWDPLKDHQNFILTAEKISKKVNNVKFILCGNGVTKENELLVSWIEDAGISNKTFLLGRREDISKIMPGLDLLISSSSGEGFPNVIGEAMACEVPCVVTDVGDSAYIVGDTGLVVQPKDSNALANASLQLIESSLGELGYKARERIIKNFELNIVTQKFEEAYLTLIKKQI
ncbi:glycosyltransferase [Bacillus sp. F19]|nr:glycosyltransferase [Bacillus sp. F19]